MRLCKEQAPESARTAPPRRAQEPMFSAGAEGLNQHSWHRATVHRPAPSCQEDLPSVHPLILTMSRPFRLLILHRKSLSLGLGPSKVGPRVPFGFPPTEWLQGFPCPTCVVPGDGHTPRPAFLTAKHLQRQYYMSPPLDTQTACSDLIFRDQVGVLGTMRIPLLQKLALLWMFQGRPDRPRRGSPRTASHPSAH